jgi:transcriptional regulator GlxA family with amidase domain
VLLLDGRNIEAHGYGENDKDPSFYAMKRHIAFYIFPQFQLLDLTGPLTVFHMAAFVRQPAPYRISVISRQGGPIPSTAGLPLASVAMRDQRPDTLIVVGGRGSRDPDIREQQLDPVCRLARRSRRVASVCTGAFILAAAGLLDGRRATTHWRHAARLQREHDLLKVDGERIFIKDGSIWTSAGITAGIDLALAMIEEDCGHDLARSIAQEMVVYQRRSGGQSQFSPMLDLEPETDRIRRALSFAQEHIAEPLPVERLAEIACISPRHFGRAFRAETGETPAKAIERLRADAARSRIETSAEPIEQIAQAVGFSDPERMRRAFVRRFGHPPQALRRIARAAYAPPSLR